VQPVKASSVSSTVTALKKCISASLWRGSGHGGPFPY
jgi:hypothetical protein